MHIPIPLTTIRTIGRMYRRDITVTEDATTIIRPGTGIIVTEIVGIGGD